MGTSTLTTRGKMLNDLNDKRKVFVSEYVVDFNGERAATVAGYKCPRQSASNLLREPEIQQAIGRILSLRQRENGHSAQRILQELAYIAYFDYIDVVNPDTGEIRNVDQIPKRARRAIDTIKQRVHYDKDGKISHIDQELKPISKTTAIELVMKHRQMLNGSQAQGDGGPSIDWKKLSGANRAITEDPLENRILEIAKQDTKALNAAATDTTPT